MHEEKNRPALVATPAAEMATTDLGWLRRYAQAFIRAADNEEMNWPTVVAMPAAQMVKTDLGWLGQYGHAVVRAGVDQVYSGVLARQLLPDKERQRFQIHARRRLCIELLSESLPTIGRREYRDHTTILHSRRTHRAMCERDFGHAVVYELAKLTVEAKLEEIEDG